MRGDQIPSLRAGKGVTCPGYAREVDVEASIWLVHYTVNHRLSHIRDSVPWKYFKSTHLGRPGNYLQVSITHETEDANRRFVPHADISYPIMRYRNAPINVKPTGGRRGIRRDFDRSLWAGGRASELYCCPGGRDIWIFVRASDHKSFPGLGNFVYLTSHFWLGVGNFTAIFWEMLKSRPVPRQMPQICTLWQRWC